MKWMKMDKGRYDGGDSGEESTGPKFVCTKAYLHIPIDALQALFQDIII